MGKSLCDPHEYYDADRYDGVEIRAVDVIEAFNLNWHKGTAISYIIRAGHKPGNSAEVDILKAIGCLNMELDRLRNYPCEG